MMKKTTQTVLLVLGAFLILVTAASVQAQPANPPDFTGTWNTATNKSKKMILTLEQGRGTVRGNYPANGLSMASYKKSDDSIWICKSIGLNGRTNVAKHEFA